MFFSKNSEFIEALYTVFFSTLHNKEQIIKKIYDEYLKFGVFDKDFEEIYSSLNDTNINLKQHHIDFLKYFNGRLMSIKNLLDLKIKIHHLTNYPHIHNVYGVIKNNGKYFCNQCSNINQKQFFTYTLHSNKTTYCKRCLQFGRSDNRLLKFHINIPTETHSPVALPKTILAPWQKEASDTLAYNSKNFINTLVWAVCGAGKTEIIYATLTTNLNEGKTICIAVPRKDVVKELYLRLTNDFNMKINVLHGDEKVLTTTNLYIMTTHQLISYYKFFDIVIVDEVDAFPYYGDTLLEQGVLTSLKEKSTLIFLSATPSKKIKKSVDCILKVPIRYHRALLPIPKVKIDRKLNLANLSKEIIDFITKCLNANRRCFIFVPTIKIGQALLPLVKIHFEKVTFVHSKDKKRDQKIKDFRDKKINILITTTILERGVTFDYLDVLIFDASHEVFTKEALIQMSGRVGRKNYDTSGVIIFLASDKNKTITAAIKEINYMNNLAVYRKLNKE